MCVSVVNLLSKYKPNVMSIEAYMQVLLLPKTKHVFLSILDAKGYHN